MICIRIFKTREEAELAKKILEEGEIFAEVSEDKLNNVPIQEFGVQARFRLHVADKDFIRAARFLLTELKKAKKSRT